VALYAQPCLRLCPRISMATVCSEPGAVVRVRVSQHSGILSLD